jgi:hypothetical protein
MPGAQHDALQASAGQGIKHVEDERPSGNLGQSLGPVGNHLAEAGAEPAGQDVRCNAFQALAPF